MMINRTSKWFLLLLIHSLKASADNYNYCIGIPCTDSQGRKGTTLCVGSTTPPNSGCSGEHAPSPSSPIHKTYQCGCGCNTGYASSDRCVFTVHVSWVVQCNGVTHPNYEGLVSQPKYLTCGALG